MLKKIEEASKTEKAAIKAVLESRTALGYRDAPTQFEVKDDDGEVLYLYEHGRWIGSYWVERGDVIPSNTMAERAAR